MEREKELKKATVSMLTVETTNEQKCSPFAIPNALTLTYTTTVLGDTITSLQARETGFLPADQKWLAHTSDSLSFYERERR